MKKEIIDNFSTAYDAVMNEIKEAGYHPKDIELPEVLEAENPFITSFFTCSFHIQECPEWLFGLWLVWDKHDNKTKDVKATFFTQFENTIDKFKPSCSEYCTEMYIAHDSDPEFYNFFGNMLDTIKFIIDEPYLAFARDYSNWDYNLQLQNKRLAKQLYRNYKSWKAKIDKMDKKADKELILAIKENILPLYIGSVIVDYGDNCSPRYEIIAPISQNMDILEGATLEMPSFVANLEEEDQELLDKIAARYKKKADKLKHLWYNPVSRLISFYRDDIFKQICENNKLLES